VICQFVKLPEKLRTTSEDVSFLVTLDRSRYVEHELLDPPSCIGQVVEEALSLEPAFSQCGNLPSCR
jgi:hypothetical protein